MTITNQQYMLLTAIAANPGLHALGVYERLAAEMKKSPLRGFFRASMASAYGGIHQLVDKRLVKFEPRTVNGKERKVFFISDDGRKALEVLHREFDRKAALVGIASL